MTTKLSVCIHKRKRKEKEKHDQSSVTLLKDIAKSNKTLKFNQSITK